MLFTDEPGKKKACLPGDIPQSSQNIQQEVVYPHKRASGLAPCNMQTAEPTPNVQIKPVPIVMMSVVTTNTYCAPGSQARRQIKQKAAGTSPVPLVTDRRINCSANQVLRTGKFSSFVTGTFDGKMVTVERVKKVNVDKAVAVEILKLNRLNVVSVLHSEQNLDYRYYATEASQLSMDQLFLKPDYSKKFKDVMPSEKVVIQQLANGLEYIHSKKLVHSDEEKTPFITSSVLREMWPSLKLFDFSSTMALMSILRWVANPIHLCILFWTETLSTLIPSLLLPFFASLSKKGLISNLKTLKDLAFSTSFVASYTLRTFH